MVSHVNCFISSACRRTHCKYTAEDDIEVFSIEDPGLDWIFARDFLTRLQKLSSYASSHLKVSELAACLEKASFSSTSSHVEFSESASHLSS
ncbi:hypothetical protein Tco_0823973 [Tanacetum coccineum]|uniref:Uncharacterized protein n=1 Tax=Tanacetum coccineum TaxID=301880 RepID=A0ABQ5AP34_9ASTR